MQRTPSLGDSVSKPITDANYVTRDLEPHLEPTSFLKLRAQIFEVELQRERQRCQETGQSMPQEWVASLERERQEILDKIEQEESQAQPKITRSLHNSPTTMIHSPAPRPSLNSISNVALEANGRARSSAPFPDRTKSRSHPRPATVNPVSLKSVNDTLGDSVRSLSRSSIGRAHHTLNNEQASANEGQPQPKVLIPRLTYKRRLSRSRPFLLSWPTTPIRAIVDGSDEYPENNSLWDPTPSPLIGYKPRPKISQSLSNVYNVRSMPSFESGRRSARGWYPSTSPTRWTEPTSTPTSTTPNAEHADYLIVDDEDDSIISFHDFSPTQYTFPAHLSPSIFSSPTSLPDRGIPRDAPSTPAKSFLGTPKDPLITTGIPLRVASICSKLMDVFRDLTKYKRFLSYRGEAAQHLLNFLQTLLDCSQLEESYRSPLLVALVRLSRKSERVPQCFSLTDVILDEESYPIADGSFGEIYKACFRGKVVCLKVLKMYQKSDQNALFKAFARETVLWGQLSHENVLPFYGLYPMGDKRNRIGLVSPWMEHGDINEFLKKNPGADRQLLLSDITHGMLYLHNNNVIHGDLKGGNILITASYRACLADFGLSSVVDSQGLRTPSLSSAGLEGGTVRFQAPELIDPKSVGPRTQASDVYAFAMVCYEIFSGTHPFSDIRSNYTVMLKVAGGERPPRPSKRLLTDTTWRLMENCWDHTPSCRPTALQIVNERLPPRLIDTRPSEGRNNLSPRLHKSSKSGYIERQDLSVVEALRVLEAIGGSS